MPVARSTTPSLLLCGYYGEHNLGDDALLQVLLQDLPPCGSLLITAADSEPVARQLWPKAVTDLKENNNIRLVVEKGEEDE